MTVSLLIDPANASLLLSARAVFRNPTAVAELLLVATARFPNPTAVAWLLLTAIATLGPNDAAELLPVWTSEIPCHEIASPPLVVSSVVLVSVDAGSVSADAVAVPMPRARRGAPAHIMTAPNTVLFIGVSFHYQAT